MEDMTPNRLAELEQSRRARVGVPVADIGVLWGASPGQSQGYADLAARLALRLGMGDLFLDPGKCSLDQAWGDGWRAGFYPAEPPAECPHGEGEARDHWMRGYGAATSALARHRLKRDLERVGDGPDKEPMREKTLNSTARDRRYSEVTDVQDMYEIWAAYRKNGGALSYEQIEAEPRFRLFGGVHSKGKNAYRIVKRFDWLMKRGRVEIKGGRAFLVG